MTKLSRPFTFLFMLTLMLLPGCSTNQQESFMHKFILKSPMVIFTEKDKTLPCFIFPKGVSVYYDSDSKYFDGFSRYIVYVNISDADTGDNSILEKSSDKSISPVWLHKIDKDTLEFMLHNFPLSKNDLSLIIKENGITKDDLADIIRNMPDD